MSINIAKRRTTSVIPNVTAFNNWFNVHQRKVSNHKNKSNRFNSTTFYRSTLPVNPQNSAFFQNQQQPRHTRTYSSFKNTQSRLTITKDELLQMSRQINYMTQRIKKTRLDMKILQKQLCIQLQQKQQLLKQKISGLKKFVKSSIKDNETRGQQIKTITSHLRDNYHLMRDRVDQMQSRLAVIENECGFMTFKSKLII